MRYLTTLEHYDAMTDVSGYQCNENGKSSHLGVYQCNEMRTLKVNMYIFISVMIIVKVNNGFISIYLYMYTK